MNPDLSRRQFLRNLAANLLGLALGVVTGVILTPYWIRSFGVAAYGLVPLTNNLVAYFGLATIVLSSSISRFVTLEVGRGDLPRANRIFNTSLWASVILSLIVFVAGAYAAGRAESLIDVPAGFEGDARLMFVLGTGAFVLSLVQTPFATAQFAANRIDLSAWLGIAMRIVQVAVAVGLVVTVYPRPGALMLGYLAGAAVSAAAAIYWWRRLMPWSRIEWRLDPGVLREQAAFGSWSVINQLGSLLYLQIDLLVVNRLLGPVAGGQYAALSQWSFLVRGLGGTVSQVFGPSIVHRWAQNDVAGVVSYTRWAIRVMGLFLALPIGLVCGLGAPLLQTWLGPGFAQHSWVLLVMVLHLAVNISVYPLFSLQAAVNRVKVPALVTCAMGVGNAVLAVALTRSWGLMGVATAGAIMMTAKNMLFTPLYAARALDAPRGVFFREIAKVAAIAGGLTGLGLVASAAAPLASWPRLALAGAALSLVYAAVVWLVLLGPGERTWVRDRLRRLGAPGVAAPQRSAISMSSTKDGER